MRGILWPAAMVFVAVGLMSAQQYKVLWSFGASGSDGQLPVASLIFDHAGNLYGTTLGGGAYSQGSVFELSPNSDGSWAETTLYSFCPSFPQLCADGQAPKAGLLLDSSGNLYGTTYSGGTSTSCGTGGGCGTIFELSPSAGAWTESVLYNFCSNYVNHECVDGANPTSQLIAGSAGTIYGTTTSGGTGHYSGGIAFKLFHRNGAWHQNVIYNFCSLGQGRDCPDGATPKAGVTQDELGNLYGTTSGGGSHGGGTVYELSPAGSAWTETVVRSGGSEGGGPLGTVSIDGLGNLYSTAAGGGDSGNGTVFRLKPRGGSTVLSFGNANQGALPAAGVLLDFRNNAILGTTQAGGTGQGNVYQIVPLAQMTSLYSFCSQPNCTDGSYPASSLIEDQSGNLYGTTKFGGTSAVCLGGCGVVFEIVQPPSAQKQHTEQTQTWRTIFTAQEK